MMIKKLTTALWRPSQVSIEASRRTVDCLLPGGIVASPDQPPQACEQSDGGNGCEAKQVACDAGAAGHAAGGRGGRVLGVLACHLRESSRGDLLHTKSVTLLPACRYSRPSCRSLVGRAVRLVDLCPPGAGRGLAGVSGAIPLCERACGYGRYWARTSDPPACRSGHVYGWATAQRAKTPAQSLDPLCRERCSRVCEIGCSGARVYPFCTRGPTRPVVPESGGGAEPQRPPGCRTSRDEVTVR